jgi:hypothetical protein
MLGHHYESVDMQPIRHAGTFQGAHEEVDQLAGFRVQHRDLRVARV